MKKFIAKLLGIKMCACGTKSFCEHLNTKTNKVWVEYCLDCNKIIKEI